MIRGNLEIANGIIIGGDYVAGQLYFDGRPQGANGGGCAGITGAWQVASPDYISAQANGIGRAWRIT